LSSDSRGGVTTPERYPVKRAAKSSFIDPAVGDPGIRLCIYIYIIYIHQAICDRNASGKTNTRDERENRDVGNRPGGECEEGPS
jgi:hypothetical protein